MDRDKFDKKTTIIEYTTIIVVSVITAILVNLLFIKIGC